MISSPEEDIKPSNTDEEDVCQLENSDEEEFISLGTTVSLDQHACEYILGFIDLHRTG